MRLPRVTIEYYEEESYAPGKLSFPLIAGFGIHWAWVYLFMFGGSSPFCPEAGADHSLMFLVSAAFLALTLLSYGVFLNAARNLFGTPRKRNRNRIVAALLVFISMCLMLMANNVDALAVPCSIAAGVLSGIGSAVLLMSYGVSCSVCDLPTLSVSIAAAFLMSVVLFVGVVALDVASPIAGMLVVLAFPLLEAWCLHACSAQLVDRLSFNMMTMPVNKAPFALHVVAPALVFSIILSILRVHATKLVIGGSVELIGSIFLAGVVVAALIVLSMYTQRKANNFAFRTLCPVAALLIASLILPGADSDAWRTFALLASYLMLEACMWIMCSDISQRFRISAFMVFGFGRGALAAGSVVVYVLSLSGGPFWAEAFDVEMLVALALVAITFGVAMLPGGSELRRTLKRGRQCPAFSTSDDLVMGLDDDLKVGMSQLSGKVSAAIRSDDGVKESCADDGCDDSAGSLSEDATKRYPEADAKQGEGADASCEFADRVEPPDDEAASAKMPQRQSRVSDEDGTASGSDADGGSDGSSDADSADSSSDSFKLKCSSVAERYLLSRKETEVLFLLARGHNSAYIQKMLYISAGTANTHMRHIYRKLDVHSQQELIETVEAEPLE